ncbi:MAG: O-antigen polysaccharide polymerase Wzy [Ruminococcaceae bacterium]|nr:O-antigen polysaccharide polymerase Wzy [Oscillospiraceae bacterium]
MNKDFNIKNKYISIKNKLSDVKFKNNFVLVALIVINVICLSVTVLTSNVFVGLTFTLWINIICYCLFKFKERALLFFFSIAFFTFLIGRVVLEQMFNYNVETFSTETNLFAERLVLFSLTVVFVTFFLLDSFIKKKDRPKKCNIYRIRRIRIISKWLFFIFSLGSILYTCITLYIVIKRTYHFTYTQEYTNLINKNIILYVLSKTELFMPIALYVFLGTMPKKKECILPIAIQLLYLVLSLGTGQRAIIVLGVFVLIIYVVYRNSQDKDEVWISKKIVIIGIISVPFILVFFVLLNHWRAGYNSSTSIFDGVRDFFYQQGYSINVIKYTYELQDQLPQDKLYSLEFLFSGIIARIFGLPVYEGNSIAHAIDGNSLAHALAYIKLGEESYLAGHGTGTAYIAELYHDFDIFGVIIGNILVGAILLFCSRLSKEKPLTSAVKMIMIPQLLWMPRGMFTDFIGVLLRPTTFLLLIVIFGGEWVIGKLLKKYGLSIVKKFPKCKKLFAEFGVLENV